eukprot:1627548-Amphidinium_carterae.2
MHATRQSATNRSRRAGDSHVRGLPPISGSLSDLDDLGTNFGELEKALVQEAAMTEQVIGQTSSGAAVAEETAPDVIPVVEMTAAEKQTAEQWLQLDQAEQEQRGTAGEQTQSASASTSTFANAAFLL